MSFVIFRLMAFLDPKEEILQIVLTQHGRKKLAKGEFSPKYFSFSDDEVDYVVSSISLSGSGG